MKKLCLLLALILCMSILPSPTQGEKLHFALRSKDAGPCQRLLGDVEILVVLVNTPNHPWTEAQRQAVKNVSYSSLEYMKKNAQQYQADFRPQLGFLEFSVSTEYDADLAWYWEIIRNIYGEQSIAQVYDRYRKDLNVDEAPILFMFNSWDISHTYTSYVDYPDWNEEFCVIFCDTDMHDNYLTHELYHQYGAIDLYDYHDEGVARLASQYFGDNVMQCTGRSLDPLNAYLIGFTDELSESAYQFLNATNGLRD